MADKTRRRILKTLGGIATVGAASGTVAGRDYSSNRDYQGGGHDSTSNRDYQNTNYPEIRGYSKRDDARREAICEFGSDVVFPVLTAVSMEDGIPVSTVTVAKSWAAFSSGCYVVDQLDEAHGQHVQEAALYIDSHNGRSIIQPPN